MNVVEVDRKLLRELQALGFPLSRAANALHYSGNSGLEDAVNWIIDHENDADIDQMPLVAVNIEIDSSEPEYTNEEMEMKVQELRDRAHQKKEVKKLEREGEKERIRAGKELLETKRIAEENERKRFLALRKAEKEEEKRAREKIRQKIDADKAKLGIEAFTMVSRHVSLEAKPGVERRHNLGFLSENPAAVNPSISIVHNKMNPLPVLSVTKAEHMRECLRSLKRNHKGDDARVKRAFQTLLIYVGNVIKNPNEEKFRKIRVGNLLFQDRVGSMKEGVEFLELCGFEKTEGGNFLFLPHHKVDMAALNSAGSVLRSALTNPFFGVLSG
ncbi:hypothetical protein EZV62_019379 [Acer yangbiense]|uniref:UBA domain-containing protein n=1 Tax=Acer yangbiense TaxID=1000413 RepID=A0A5C7HA70_9ROSI|nr:hypothetical protein EZV62_019379 [Acer yangbiense]